MIVILLGGHIAVDSESKRIDWSGTDALPPFMAEYLATVPLYLDLRKLARLEDIDLDDPNFKCAINGIVARFRGIDSNEMLGRGDPSGSQEPAASKWRGSGVGYPDDALRELLVSGRFGKERGGESKTGRGETKGSC